MLGRLYHRGHRAQRPEQRGDTIIEVMLVLAIVGLAIGVSFATASDSLSSVQAAQQNTQATALLQRQIEDLRYLADNPPPAPGIYQTSGYYCIDDTVAPVAMSTAFSGTLSSYSIYPAACVVNSTYHLAISYTNVNDTFTATAVWDNAQGFGQDTATLVYRVHP